MKVNHAFKAKKEAFREHFCAKVKKWPFWHHLTLRNPERDENGFWKKILPNLMPNPGFSGSWAQVNIFASGRDFACSLLSINLMEFQWFWSPFGHFPSVPYRGQTLPAGPGSTQEILIPCAGAAPPLQYISFTSPFNCLYNSLYFLYISIIFPLYFLYISFMFPLHFLHIPFVFPSYFLCVSFIFPLYFLYISFTFPLYFLYKPCNCFIN